MNLLQHFDQLAGARCGSVSADQNLCVCVEKNKSDICCRSEKTMMMMMSFMCSCRNKIGADLHVYTLRKVPTVYG
jgi:hypothetical protein